MQLFKLEIELATLSFSCGRPGFTWHLLLAPFVGRGRRESEERERKVISKAITYVGAIFQRGFLTETLFGQRRGFGVARPISEFPLGIDCKGENYVGKVQLNSAALPQKSPKNKEQKQEMKHVLAGRRSSKRSPGVVVLRRRKLLQN